MTTDLQSTIEAAWDARDTLGLTTQGSVREAVETALAGLDDGSYRVAERDAGGTWQVNQWLKKAVLLSFRLYDSVPMDGGASFPGLGAAPWFDKVPLKTTGWDAKRFVVVEGDMTAERCGVSTTQLRGVETTDLAVLTTTQLR